MMRVLIVLGTRPEAIKIAPIVAQLKQRPRVFSTSLCVTGQHRELLDQALQPFGLTPDIDLAIMQPGHSLADVTARAIAGLDRVLAEQRPDMVLVQGDTTTALCGALAAYYCRIPVAHVEAGLRTGDKYSPFPEEVNRRLVGHIADYHFAPTPAAKATLLDEGIRESRVFVTGNTVIDALLWMRDRIRSAAPPLPPQVAANIDGRRLIVVTGHRRESFGEPLRAICRAIRDVADAYEDVAFVYPVHLNPNVRGPVEEIIGDHPRVHLTPPLAYAPFVSLMDRCSLVLTDSGGVQEEAPSLGKPVLVMRDTTERPEGIAAGTARLVGVTRDGIVAGLRDLLDDRAEYNRMAHAVNPYGDGRAAERIADVLETIHAETDTRGALTTWPQFS